MLAACIAQAKPPFTLRIRHLKVVKRMRDAGAYKDGLHPNDPVAGTYIILPSSGTSSSATMLMILMSGLMAGPAVSL